MKDKSEISESMYETMQGFGKQFSFSVLHCLGYEVISKLTKQKMAIFFHQDDFQHVFNIIVVIYILIVMFEPIARCLYVRVLMLNLLKILSMKTNNVLLELKMFDHVMEMKKIIFILRSHSFKTFIGPKIVVTVVVLSK